MLDCGVFPKKRCEPTDVGAEGSSYMLGRIGREIANTWKNLG
jgi:hypothetical protein